MTHDAPSKKAKITGSLPFGKEVIVVSSNVEQPKAQGETKRSPYWLELEDGNWIHWRGENGATFAAPSQRISKATQFLVTGEGELCFPEVPGESGTISQEQKTRSQTLPKGWRLIMLDKKGTWMQHQIGWTELTKGIQTCKDIVPVARSDFKVFYPPPEMEQIPESKVGGKVETAEAEPSAPSGGPPPPPKRVHMVKSYEFIKVDAKDIEKLVAVKALTKGHKKAILGVAACLLRGQNGVLSPWFIGYFHTLAKALKMPKKDMQSLEPLIHQQKALDPKPFIAELPHPKPGDAKKDINKGGQVLSKERMRLELTLLHLSLQAMGYYDARTRRFLRDLCDLQGIRHDLFGRYEDCYCEALRGVIKAAEEAKSKHKQNWKWRWAKIGGVAVVGGVATALTAGLAAPFVGAGLVAVGGGTAIAGAGAFLATSSGVILFGGALGAYSTRLIGYKVDKRIADVKEFEFKPMTEKSKPESKEGSMSVVMCINGWHYKDGEGAEEELNEIWGRGFVPYYAPGREVYAIQWETKEQKAFGSALSDLAAKQLTGYAVAKTVAMTSLGAVAAAMAMPVLIIDLADIIDNAYSVALNRADKAAMILAQTLMDRIQGNRPVTLIGYSLGARMIFKALLILAEQQAKAKVEPNIEFEDDNKATNSDKNKAKCKGKDNQDKRKMPKVWDEGKDEPQGMVMDVVLMGAPVTSDTTTWEQVRSVVSGRLINVYSHTDWILRMLCRTNELSYSLAGIQEICGVKNMENLDVNDIVASHFDYDKQLPKIMQRIKFYP